MMAVFIVVFLCTVEFFHSSLQVNYLITLNFLIKGEVLFRRTFCKQLCGDYPLSLFQLKITQRKQKSKKKVDKIR